MKPSDPVPLMPVLKAEFKSTLIYVSTNFLIQFGNLLVIPLYWRKLSPQDYGILAVTEIIGALFGSYANCALEQGVNRFYYRWPEESRRVNIGTLWMASWLSVILSGLATMGALWLLAPFLFPGVPFQPFLLLGLLGAITVSFRLIALTTLRIRKRPIPYAIFAMAQFLIGIAMSMIFVLYLDKGVEGYLQANVISGGILLLVSAVIMGFFATPSFRLDCLRESWLFCYPIIFSNLMAYLNTILDRFYLQKFSTLEAVGLYSLGLKFAQAIMGLHDAIKLSYAPFVWKTIAKDIRGREIIASMSPIFTLPLFIAGAGLALYIKPLIHFIGQDRYFSVTEYVPILAGITVLSCLYMYFAPGIMLSGKTKLLSVPTTLQFVVILFSAPFLITNYGTSGILGLKLIGALIFLLMSMIISNKVFPIPYDWKRLGIFFSATASAIAFTYAGRISNIVTNTAVFLALTAVLLYPTREYVRTALRNIAVNLRAKAQA